MSAYLNPTRNNSNPVEFKKEPQEQSEELEILEQIINNEYSERPVPFKKEKFDHTAALPNKIYYDKEHLIKRVKQLATENELLKDNESNLLAKIDELNEIVETKTQNETKYLVEIERLKLQLNEHKHSNTQADQEIKASNEGI